VGGWKNPNARRKTTYRVNETEFEGNCKKKGCVEKVSKTTIERQKKGVGRGRRYSQRVTSRKQCNTRCKNREKTSVVGETQIKKIVGRYLRKPAASYAANGGAVRNDGTACRKSEESLYN